MNNKTNFHITSFSPLLRRHLGKLGAWRGIKHILFLPAFIFLFASCEDMLTIDSSRYVTADDNSLSSANDSVFSVLGVLSGLQNIAERYIILGELRADLMDVTAYTPASIRQLNNFTVETSNEYADSKDYYAIINNCNYFISKTNASDHPLKRENALMHAVRAWVYMQIVFNWGEAYYFTNPLLSVEDTEKEYPLCDINQVVDSLITDLEPYANVVYPSYGTVYEFNSNRLFIPVKILLGDLYLWRGSAVSDYERAAGYYAEYINTNTNELTDIEKEQQTFPVIKWSSDSFQSTNNSWSTSTIASSLNTEMITAIQMAEYESEGKTASLTTQYYSFTASTIANSLWNNQIYIYYNNSGTTEILRITAGDLRKEGNLVSFFSDNTDAVLYKIYNADHILLYRMPLIYLRYAEAVNRAGKPHTAFSVLKYGLNSNTLQKYVPEAEWKDVAYITPFTHDKYDNVPGIHARGCGESSLDDSYAIGFGEALAAQDTIRWVEDAICTELALETSFEGNRFQDLMRFAMRRNDNAFLAEQIAAKHEDNYEQIRTLLSDEKNWFLPKYAE